MKFFTQDDLIIRRVYLAKSICEGSKKHVNKYLTGEKVNKSDVWNLSYLVASLEAVECYVPIIDESEDGVKNCLTEKLIEKLFDNIEMISGHKFQPKGTSYDPNSISDPTEGALILLNGNINIDLNSNAGTLAENLSIKY